MKYPGGYQIIDLGGLSIAPGDDPVSIDPKPWELAKYQKKPIILTNAVIGGAIISPTLLTNDSNYSDMLSCLVNGGTINVIISLDNYPERVVISAHNVE